MRLTKTLLDKLTFAGKAPTSRDLRWDDEVPGFGVRVWPSGRLTYFVVYRAAGRERFMGLGAHGILTLVQARDMARLVKVQVLQGKDPLTERRRKAHGKTFGDLVEAFERRHMTRLRPNTRAAYGSVIRLYLGPLRPLQLTAIRQADLALWHHKIGETYPSSANQALIVVKAMYTLADEWGFTPPGTINPAKGIRKFPEERRQRFVTPDEMPRLVRAIEGEQNLVAQAVVWMYLLTGLRKTEVLRIKWADVDFTRREIRIPRTKTTATTVPLTTWMERIVREMPRMAGNPHVFHGRGRGRHFSDVHGAWVRIRTAAGLEDVRIHDLRHTVASWLVSSGASLALVGRVLHHASPVMTERYAHFLTAPVAGALEAHGNALQAILTEDGDHAEPSRPPDGPGASS